MSTITKERAELKAFITGFLTDPAHDNQSSRSMTAEVFRIALASLKAEPVAWRSLYYENHGLLTGSKNVLASWQKQGWGCEPLYTAPPAPTVPNECPAEIRELMASYSDALFGDEDAQEIWNACRAAMLQGSDGDSPVIPEGWVACSERMPKKNDKVLIFIDFNSEHVPPSIHDAEFTGATFRRGGATVNVYPLEDGYGVTHWQSLPSPPAK